MDLHPLIVHFPVALLTVYSALEVIRRFLHAPSWWYTRAVLVIAGTISAFLSLTTGEQAEHMLQDRSLHSVVELHSAIATATTWVYAVLAACYVLLWLERVSAFRGLPQGVQKITDTLRTVATKIMRSPLAVLLAVLGFVGLAATGSLGGILVYGPDADPLTQFIYNLFFGG